MSDLAIYYQHLFLAIFFPVVGLFYFFLVKAKASKHPKKLIHVGERFSLHWWNHLVFGTFRILITVGALSWWIWPNTTDTVFGTFEFPLRTILVGDALLLIGFSLAIFSAISLNGHWRSGIDASTKGLVTKGLYRFSRNPAYIGVKIAQLGFFLAWPSVFSAICLVVGWVSVNVQIALEERHLLVSHGRDYQRYRKITPRWGAAFRSRRC